MWSSLRLIHSRSFLAATHLQNIDGFISLLARNQRRLLYSASGDVPSTSLILGCRSHTVYSLLPVCHSRICYPRALTSAHRNTADSSLYLTPITEVHLLRAMVDETSTLRLLVLFQPAKSSETFRARIVRLDAVYCVLELPDIFI